MAGDSVPEGGPAIVGANWYRFVAGEQIRHAEVASVAFIWPLTGSGQITSRGQRFQLDSTCLLRLPWRHDVEYVADERSPFKVGTIHLVPWHRYDVPVSQQVAHRPGDPLLHADWRRGDPLLNAQRRRGEQAEQPQLLSGLNGSGRHIVTLGSYAVERFLEGALSDGALRALGVLLAEASAYASTPQDAGVPAVLEVMMEYVRVHLDRALTVDDIARAGDCSTTTAQRLFARYTGQSVLAWTRRRQIEEAALLLRTTGMRVNEVAKHVGFADPLYFSRAFRTVFGVPPSRYAAAQLRP
ncbi:helix-turn-helix transcriptional regulator [Ruania alkalisoli]|uniref:Helix-turn-helix transcriptional regulator n=1 Tax=Ruania alkalisoli TaxID=2779775 RepID=A0A7M1STI8_9MICO|nr:AraC family transcriptional regulator [Ruania alkalisoli]QOR70771.1 helix-turn-helix transcriptional regulator [Ruania alkalisoli]